MINNKRLIINNEILIITDKFSIINKNKISINDPITH